VHFGHVRDGLRHAAHRLAGACRAGSLAVGSRGLGLWDGSANQVDRVIFGAGGAADAIGGRAAERGTEDGDCGRHVSRPRQHGNHYHRRPRDARLARAGNDGRSARG
jgi:hypothetical protein